VRVLGMVRARLIGNIGPVVTSRAGFRGRTKASVRKGILSRRRFLCRVVLGSLRCGFDTRNGLDILLGVLFEQIGKGFSIRQGRQFGKISHGK